ncbi:MAG: 50S ribosomal protein L6 [Candidatus Paceibacterota bacterium]
MSRVGKQELEIPEKTEVTVGDGFVSVKGPLGELSKKVRSEVSISTEGRKVTFSPTKKNPLAYALWGTYASHVKNMIDGVNTPFEKKLLIEGVGYRASLEGNVLVLAVGYSHQVRLPIPEGVNVTVEKNLITVSGIDKEEVGEFTATIRAKKKPEPYKGKGIRYEGEVVRRKQGKKVVS